MYFVNKQFLALLTFKSFRLHRLLWNIHLWQVKLGLPDI